MFHVEHDKQKIYLNPKDHLVSGEFFELHLRPNGVLQTVPSPTEEELPAYYKSERYISHTNTKKTLLEYLYHLVRSYTITRKTALISKLVNPKGSLLDVGCGTGVFLKSAQKKGWEIYGIEPNPKARQEAIAKVGLKVFDTANTLNLTDHCFDVITLWHVLEHVSDPKEYILSLSKHLKPGGFIIIAAPNHQSYDAKHYKSYWAAYDVPRHLWHFSKDSIRLFLSDIGFTVLRSIPMYFDAFYISLLSEKYKRNKSSYFRAFIVGLISNTKAIVSGNFSSLIYIVKNKKS